MKKRLAMAVGLALLVAVQSGQAFRPAGWVYHSYPWAYDSGSDEWYWFNTADTQWVYGYPPADGWRRFADCALANGWVYYSWPFAYCANNGAWHWTNDADVQWVVNMTSGIWARFGTTPSVYPGMVMIPAGSFQMGNSMDPNEGSSAELPVHSVYVSAFHMDRHEVTKALWEEVYTWAIAHGYSFDNAGSGKAANHPVQMVNWYDMVKWSNARSEKAGLTACYTVGGVVYKTGQSEPDCNWSANGYRLPTEAEWEKAARGGASGRRFPWSDSDTIQHVRANYHSLTMHAYDTSGTRGYHPDYEDSGTPYTSPVGSFAPNGYGLYDMAGNVWELCWDWYDSAYYGVTPSSDPRGPSSGQHRVSRGGGWNYFAIECRVAHRSVESPDSMYYFLGFRLVRSAP